jgi:hypothetical protein
MTPRNPLDGKLIIDREAAERILKHLEMHSCSNVTAFRHAFIRPLEQALAQDNTGWAAVPVKHTPDMASAAVKALENSICADIDFHLSWVNTADQEVQLVSCLGRTHCAMLNASPVLLETKGKTK